MEILEDFYTTVAEEASAEFEEKRSRFIGYAAPAATVFGIIICASYYLYLRRGGKYAIDTKQPK